VRIREGRLLQFKFDAQDITQAQQACIEREYALSSLEPLPKPAHRLFERFLPAWQPAASWEANISTNHLLELARIDKYRRVYVDSSLIICVDQVAGLGSFVEIERNEAEGTAIRAAEEHVCAVLEEIGGTPVNAGYFEMWLFRNNHAAYQWVPPRFRVEDGQMSFS